MARLRPIKPERVGNFPPFAPVVVAYRDSLLCYDVPLEEVRRLYGEHGGRVQTIYAGRPPLGAAFEPMNWKRLDIILPESGGV